MTPFDVPSPRPGSDPHLLYVAWGYPPCRGSGVYRAWATANAFAQAGWRVTVITAPREIFLHTGGIDTSLERTIDPSIRVVRVPFNDPLFTNDLRVWSGWRARNPELWAGAYGRYGTISFPEPKYGAWRWAISSAARRIHREDPVDLVIGTANPHVDFLPGYVLHREHGVPHVMDYRDAWALDIYSGRRKFPVRSAAGKWESRLLASAEEVWFVNRPIKEWHAREHPELADRFLVVENGYDYTFDLPAPKTFRKGEGLTFGYIGTIANAVPIEELVAGWELARSRSDLVRASRIELYGYLNHTGVPGDNLVRAMSAFERNGIAYRGPVARADVASVYATFDALVLTFGAGEYITGGKVYEYASTGLPIASVHDPVNETSRILADYPGWRGVSSLRADDVADAFIAVADLAASQTATTRQQAVSFANRFAREAQLAPRIARLTQLVRKGER